MNAPTTFSQTDVALATILVVDDMEANRAVLARRLEKFGYRVICVDSGHAALAFINGRVRQGGVISAVAVGHRQAALAVMCRG